MGNRALLLLGHRRIAFAASVALLATLALTACAPEPVADGSQNTGPTPSATIPAPEGGSVDDVVVAAEDQPEEADPDPTPINSPAELTGGVVVDVVDASEVETKAETPGETAGPAVAIRLQITNGTAAALDLSTVMVSVTGADDAYGQPTTSSPAAPFSGELAVGQSAEGIYVFGLPAEQRDDLSIRVEYVAGSPIALFVGEI